MLVINSPANPTGGVVAPEDLEQIAWWAEKLDVLLLSDEVFERFQHDGEQVSLATLPKAPLPNAHHRQRKQGTRPGGRPGRLAGGAAASDPPVPGYVSAAHAIRADAVATGTRWRRLRTDVAAFEAIREAFDSRRHYASERLRAMGLNAPWPAGAFFFWVPVWDLGKSGRSFAETLVREKKVQVTPGDLFGPSGSRLHPSQLCSRRRPASRGAGEACGVRRRS